MRNNIFNFIKLFYFLINTEQKKYIKLIKQIFV